MTEVRKMYTDRWFKDDKQFNEIYPAYIRALASRHWTPLVVAQKAAAFLAVDKGSKILDIGSGAGKFCLAAAWYQPTCSFFGIEQRKDLIRQAEIAKELLCIDNAFFLHGNFTKVDFDQYDHFYFYNSFYENLAWAEKIDYALEYSHNLYRYYNFNLRKMLADRPDGTRLVTYHSMEDEVPESYQIVGMQLDGLLKFWVKAPER
ncbi:methyltransferase domain-containing protein [Taibaiella soli]|uniref:Methyltransferase n=1 Tax=Taibaiella soli TaxID=1649169 RepID=A0A2W2B8Y5_9BACT|nr:methyltransferase domain-containing protein [Taibaiella soli]PZF72759.1 methyltransferase [Taibaiella soli]